VTDVDRLSSRGTLLPAGQLFSGSPDTERFPMPAIITILFLILVVSACDTYPKAAPPAAPAPTAATPAPAPPAAPVGAPGAGPIEDTNFAPSLGVDLGKSTKTASGLYYRDLTTGSGTVVTTGKQVSVHYAGWLSNGALFDQNQPGQEPFTFAPGAREVIAGWEEGVLGMKVGGKRQLIVPGALGYGAAGRPPIPPNGIMVFTVEVVGVR
jgi:hypothetical protein